MLFSLNRIGLIDSIGTVTWSLDGEVQLLAAGRVVRSTHQRPAGEAATVRPVPPSSAPILKPFTRVVGIGGRVELGAVGQGDLDGDIIASDGGNAGCVIGGGTQGQAGRGVDGGAVVDDQVLGERDLLAGRVGQRRGRSRPAGARAPTTAAVRRVLLNFIM